MSESHARPTIPPEWARKAACPVCATPGLSVACQPGVPDRMVCRTCGLAFELELNGSRLRLVRLPAALSGRAGVTVGAWLTAGELRTVRSRAASAPAHPASAPQPTRAHPVPPKNAVPAALPGDQELGPRPPAPAQPAVLSEPQRSAFLTKIQNLRALGNTYEQIQTILTQAITSPELLQAALGIAAQLESQDRSRQQKKLWSSMSIVGVLVIVIIGVAYMVQKIYIKPASIGSALQATVGGPADIVQALNLATPVVQRLPTLPAGAPNRTSTCPITPDGAANLFGGLAVNWKSSEGGWIMMSPVKATTVEIPTGMTAAYLTMGANLSLAEVHGPAKMENVYYVAVSCP